MLTSSRDEQGKQVSVWEGGEIVQAVAYDVPSMRSSVNPSNSTNGFSTGVWNFDDQQPSVMVK